MSKRIIINGATGKMGQLACKTLGAHPNFDIVAKINSNHQLGEEISAHKPDMVLDLTTANVVYDHTQAIIEHGVHPVIGTSGLSADQIKILSEQCAQKKLGGLIIPNFSIAATLLMLHSQQLAKYFHNVEIIEMHHEQKLDAPSGTARRTAELIAANKNKANDAKPNNDPSRGLQDHGIPIHAIRIPGKLAEEEVIFGAPGEILSIKHQSLDRNCFMHGLALACDKVSELTELKVGLEHVLDLS